MARHFHHGERVRVEGHVGVRDDDDPGDSQECHGLEGRVVAKNAMHRGSDGKARVAVRLENGAVISVPQEALEKRSS